MKKTRMTLKLLPTSVLLASTVLISSHSFADTRLKCSLTSATAKASQPPIKPASALNFELIVPDTAVDKTVAKISFKGAIADAKQTYEGTAFEINFIPGLPAAKEMPQDKGKVEVTLTTFAEKTVFTTPILSTFQVPHVAIDAAKGGRIEFLLSCEP